MKLTLIIKTDDCAKVGLIVKVFLTLGKIKIYAREDKNFDKHKIILFKTLIKLCH